MPTLTCPACGHFGAGGRDETSFDYLERDGLIELRRCRRCGAGLLVRFTLMPTQAYPEVIAREAWDEIRRIRGRALSDG
jgi:transcription initiation factor IIE alpha subunit